MAEIIDLTSSPVDVDLTSWIGVGKVYRDVPGYIARELESRTSLSDESRSLLPPTHITIASLRSKQLPPLTTSLFLTSTQSTFSTSHPNTPLSYLISPSRPLPPRPFLTKLRDEAGQAMLDGFISLRYWGATEIYLPFEAFGLWYELIAIVEAQAGWNSALRWMNNTHLTSRIARVNSIVQSVSWGGLISKLGRSAHVSHMSDLLSTKLLWTSHIDTMLLRLRARYRDEIGYQGRQIALFPTTSFTQRLQHLSNDVHSNNTILDSSELSMIGNFAANCQRAITIATVAYWPEEHWGFVLIVISGYRVQVKWGDGLHRKVPSTLDQGIRLWTERYLPKHVVTVDSDFLCGSQMDGYSCGIIAVNGLKYHILGDTLWTGATREECRVDEFLSCMEFCMDDRTVDAPLIPPITLAPASSAPTPVDPHQPACSQQRSSKMVTTPSPVSSPVSPPRPATKRPRRPSKLVTTPSPVSSPVSPPRPSIKRPRRGSKLNLNVLRFTPIHAKGSSMDEDNGSIALADELLDIELPNEKSEKKSKSALSKAKNNAAIANGSLVKNVRRWNAYIKKLRSLDEHVEVYEDDPTKIRLARCSSCAQVVMQSEAYNVSRFKEHIKKCKAQGSKLRVVSISTIFNRLPPSSPKPKPKPVVPIERPCSGLTAAQDKRIPQYTSRTEVRYAGGQSRTTLATNKFGQTFSLLSKDEQAEVDLLYRSTCQWELDHDDARVFSRKCLDVVRSESNAKELPQACSECLHLLTLHEFQVAIARAGTTDEKRKHIPGRYQSIVTGQLYTKNIGLGKFIKETASQKGDFLLDFTTALSSGAFDDNPSFVQLLEVMLERHKRRDNGRGLQNMRYAADFDQFCHEIQCVRPEAYRLFASKFGGRSERSMLKIRSTKPKMTVGISEATLKRVIKYLDDYNYPRDAPLACAVDDTKLHSALRPYYDQAKKTWFLLGSTGDPLIISDPEQLPELIQQASSDLGTKLRLWTLLIPLSNIPPLIMAILVISESNSADDLATVEKKLLKILLIDSTVPINIISLGSDGTVVERKARRLLIESGFAAIEYTHIPHPNTGSPPLKIEILRIGAHRLAIIQDSKHFRKTCRNNIFTGAKQLVLGNELIYYEQVRSMVLNQDHSPLYVRDVEKLDRQDDRAAARLFSAENIEHALKCGHPGLAIFLYIFGEACDAYQSRTIDHAERVHMVLLAHFFKAIWRTFLVENGYPLGRHFISQEADDISNILVNGLLAMVVIHRDHLSSPFPLLPWMHGSESNEHVFGLLRSTLPEFTIVDTLQLIPKIDIRLMEACKRAINSTGLRKGGAGYAHTHFDGSGCNLESLSHFPTQEALRQIASTAWIEANAIWEVLGYYRSTSLVSSVFNAPADLDEDIYDILDEPTMGEDESPNTETTSDRDVLDQALRAAALVSRQDGSVVSESVNNTLNECGLAAAALNMRELAALDRLVDEDPDTLAIIQAALEPILATISALGASGQAIVDEIMKNATENPRAVDVIVEEAEDPLSALSHISKYDLTVLVDERRSHQSKETTDACRPLSNRKRAPSHPTSTPFDHTKQSPRQLLARKIHETLKLSGVNIKGETSGLARQFRWTKQASGMAFPDKAFTGNAANARRAAGSRANTLIKSRKTVFATLPLTESLATANINDIFQLVNGIFGVVLYEKKLMIGKVITFYEQGGEKGGRHSWVSNASSVGAISWISMQLWAQVSSPNSFRSSTSRGLLKFGLVHSKAFLYALKTNSISIIDDQSMKLDANVFNSVVRPLNTKEGLVVAAVKKLMGKKHTYELNDGEE